MKALKLRISEDLYARFKSLHSAYGEESQVFRELLESYVKKQEQRNIVEVPGPIGQEPRWES